jgi:hypothetical protein
LLKWNLLTNKTAIGDHLTAQKSSRTTTTPNYASTLGIEKTELTQNMKNKYLYRINKFKIGKKKGQTKK